MTKISIGFSRPKKTKFLSSLIMLIEGTNYSHVFVTWTCPYIKKRKVFEAVGSGVRIVSNHIFKEQAEVIELYDFYVSEEKLIYIEQKVHAMLGRPYSFKALFGLAFMRLCNWFNRVFKVAGIQHNPYKDGRYSQICVEAGGVVLEELVFKPVEYEDFGLIDFNNLTRLLAFNKADQERLDRINGKNNS